MNVDVDNFNDPPEVKIILVMHSFSFKTFDYATAMWYFVFVPRDFVYIKLIFIAICKKDNLNCLKSRGEKMHLIVVVPVHLCKDLKLILIGFSFLTHFPSFGRTFVQLKSVAIVNTFKYSLKSISGTLNTLNTNTHMPTPYTLRCFIA